MRIDALSGRIGGVPFVPSPNCDERPPGIGISLLVVHGISLPPGEFGGPWIEELFLNRLDPSVHPYFQEIHVLRVSAHVLIRRDGEVRQYVPFILRAWHAGQSRHEGRERCNDFSVGVELEGTDDKPYEEPQYRALAQLARALGRAYPALTAGRIVGHSDISPGRKTDPGPSFEWDRLRALLRPRPRSRQARRGKGGRGAPERRRKAARRG